MLRQTYRPKMRTPNLRMSACMSACVSACVSACANWRRDLVRQTVKHPIAVLKATDNSRNQSTRARHNVPVVEQLSGRLRSAQGEATETLQRRATHVTHDTPTQPHTQRMNLRHT